MVGAPTRLSDRTPAAEELGWSRAFRLAAIFLSAVVAPSAIAAGHDVVNPAPTAKDWAALAALPDWSGVWYPDISTR